MEGEHKVDLENRKKTTIRDEIQCLLVRDFVSKVTVKQLDAVLGILTTTTKGMSIYDNFLEGLLEEDFSDKHFYNWVVEKNESIDKEENQYRKFKRIMTKGQSGFLATLDLLEARTSEKEGILAYTGASLLFELVPLYIFNYTTCKLTTNDEETMALLDVVSKFVINFLVVLELPKKTSAITELYVIKLLASGTKESNDVLYKLFKEGVYS